MVVSVLILLLLLMGDPPYLGSLGISGGPVGLEAVVLAILDSNIGDLLIDLEVSTNLTFLDGLKSILLSFLFRIDCLDNVLLGSSSVLEDLSLTIIS